MGFSVHRGKLHAAILLTHHSECLIGNVDSHRWWKQRKTIRVDGLTLSGWFSGTLRVPFPAILSFILIPWLMTPLVCAIVIVLEPPVEFFSWRWARNLYWKASFSHTIIVLGSPEWVSSIDWSLRIPFSRPLKLPPSLSRLIVNLECFCLAVDGHGLSAWLEQALKLLTTLKMKIIAGEKVRNRLKGKKTKKKVDGKGATDGGQKKTMASNNITMHSSKKSL